MKNISRIFSVAAFAAALFTATTATAQTRSEVTLTDNWRFHKGAQSGAESTTFDDSRWEVLSIPHDWAISGDFDKQIDIQVTAIVQNGETKPTEKTGRSGSLPWIGEGWYRTKIQIPAEAKHAELVFDGAMSEPIVYINGKKAGEWKYGYNAFIVDITDFAKAGEEATLAVHLNNLPESSRWYPGAGLYRPVVLKTYNSDTRLRTWGTFVRTTTLSKMNGVRSDLVARVTVTSDVLGIANKKKAYVKQIIVAPDGKRMEQTTECGPKGAYGKDVQQSLTCFDVKNPQLWSIDTPTLYTLITEVYVDNQLCDTQTERFGIRTVEVTPEGGFMLNGKTVALKGVCLHHDLGPIGTAVNRTALARQIKMLKEMGCNAIRTSHNMPSTMQMELCDELGMMVMAESFDTWIYPKVKNGYARFYNDWWERDITNLVECHRNHPSIIMWSIGNEIPDQGNADGLKQSIAMQELCHRLDPTRTVTQGLDRVDNAIWSGVLQVMDVPGLNYRTHKYEKAYANAPQGFILGSETASTVSSRGVYKFPVEEKKSHAYDDGQCSSYDLEACSWSNIPEDDWLLQDDKPWTIGEFVWTGYDYLGEPSPYDEYWPSRSSYFGIIDLAGLPKDRYYLYRSRWNTESPTLHLLPHWTWPGREGEVTPVYCYTSYDEAELFVNGKSQGRIKKDKSSRLDRYRLRWNDVVYQPGEIKVVAYDKNSKPAAEEIIKTAGKPHHIELKVDDSTLNSQNPKLKTKDSKLKADGTDLCYVIVSVVDKDGNLCPTATNQLNFSVKGAAEFKAACNGDATSLESFVKPTMKVFGGKLVVTLQSLRQTGAAELTVNGKGLKSGKLQITVEE